MTKVLTFLFLLFLISCASSPVEQNFEILQSDQEIMMDAMAKAHASGRKVLETSKTMIENKAIVVGGCWDYINAVYNRSGLPDKEREVIFKSKFKGPYADIALIEPGDWLYFVNHTYRDIEHSAIFIAWIDVDKKEALMVNYVGGNQKKPATYKRFVLDNVYNIFRGKE